MPGSHSLLLLLLLLVAPTALPCPLVGVGDAPSKALLSPLVFQGRLVALARRGPAQQAAFRVDKVLKGGVNKTLVVVEFNLRKNSSKCRGVLYKGLELAERYIVFAAHRRPRKMIAVAEPELYSKKKAIARVLCRNCARAPLIRGVSSEIKASLYAPIKLKCRASGNPPPRVMWFKKGTKVRPNDRIKIRTKRKYSHIIINRFLLEDTGEYKCIARNAVGNATAFIKVKASSSSTRITSTTTTESPFWHLRKDPCPINNFCLNGGVCIYIAIVKEYACECEDGYGGQRCETKIVSKSTFRIDYHGD